MHQAYSWCLINVWDYGHHLGRLTLCNKMSCMVHVCKIVKGHSWREERILLWGNHGWFHKRGNFRRTNLTSLDKVKWKSFSCVLILCNQAPWSVVHGPCSTRLLCPWISPGKNTGVGCHFLLQGIFPTQGSNLRLLCGRQILYHWAAREVKPFIPWASLILLWKHYNLVHWCPLGSWFPILCSDHVMVINLNTRLFPTYQNICWLGSWDDNFQVKECRNFEFDRDCPTAIQRGLINVHPISNVPGCGAIIK